MFLIIFFEFFEAYKGWHSTLLRRQFIFFSAQLFTTEASFTNTGAVD